MAIKGMYELRCATRRHSWTREQLQKLPPRMHSLDMMASGDKVVARCRHCDATFTYQTRSRQTGKRFALEQWLKENDK